MGRHGKIGGLWGRAQSDRVPTRGRDETPAIGKTTGQIRNSSGFSGSFPISRDAARQNASDDIRSHRNRATDAAERPAASGRRNGLSRSIQTFRRPRP
ncbi:hypothetical protein RSSM_01916 [Rhodopirellula sallentina SM41]|uniref:Uncharacterized protein n=1 Tax=Rhodopirellula sallentina SM41 TaxID=1263870 RepID=M5U5C8_9BACT|nr:hypothetical protein RSSM_01916 [Rhodopirellula sallentina SM41]